MQLTKDQRVFVVKTWISTRSIKQVQESFAHSFPDRISPSKNAIWKNVKKYQQEGTSLNLNKGRSGRRKTARAEENIENVRTLLLQNTNVSVRKNGLPLSKSSFNRIVLRDLKWYPYKIHVRHQLLETDLPRRRQFAEWLLHKPVRFVENIMIGDEAAFFMNGKVNTHNVRQYAPRNEPPVFNINKSMCREKLSLWIGICGQGSLVGPIFYDNNMNGVDYLNMINENIVPELHRIYGNRFNRLWWFQDGAPAHRTMNVRQKLRELFGTRVVALHHDVEWPPRSPDLTPCDFFLWGHIKSKVYATPLENINQLQERIIREVNAIKENPQMVRKVMQAMRSRAQLCIERNGGNVEGNGA